MTYLTRPPHDCNSSTGNHPSGVDAVFDGLVCRYPDLSPCRGDIEAAFALLYESFVNGGQLLICGNGGSAADSGHIVGELMKGFMKKRSLSPELKTRFVERFGEEGERLADLLQGGLPAIALTEHSALSSAVANDMDASLVFAQQVVGYGHSGDVLLAISTSGNSKNVVAAVQTAVVLGLKTVLLTGETGGVLKGLCDVAICVPASTTPDIQERHLPIYHALCIALEEAFFP